MQTLITQTLFCCMATVAIVLASADAARAAFTDDLVSYWTFDNTLADSPSLGSSNDGAVNSGTASYATGKFGAAINLPGGGTDQYVIIPEDDNDFDFAAKGNGLTISAWLKVGGFDTSWQALIAKGEGSHFRAARNSGSNNMAYAGAGNGSDIVVGSVNVNDGLWHHLVAVTESTGTGARLYIDGSTNVATTSGQAGLTDNNLNLLIGNNPQQTGRGWNGLIDDVAIWGRPLSAAEVDLVFNNGAGQSILSAATPEPNTFLMAFAALVGFGLLGRRRRNRGGTSFAVKSVTVVAVAVSSIFLATANAYALPDNYLPNPGDGTLTVRFVDIGGGGGATDTQINNTTEAESILAATNAQLAPGATGPITVGPTTYNVTSNFTGTHNTMDARGSTDRDYNVNQFNYNPLITTDEDFLLQFSGGIFFPAGNYSVHFDSDDGASLKIPGAGFFNSFDKNLPGIVGTDELRYEGTTGNSDTGANFIFATDTVTLVEGIFFERSGGDFFEVAIGNGLFSSFNTTDFPFVIAEGNLGIELNSTAFASIPEPSTFLMAFMALAGVCFFGWRRRRTRCTQAIVMLMVVGLMLTGVGTAQAAPIVFLEDDFNDDSLDGMKWNVVTAGIPQNPKSAVEQNQQMELEGRAHLNTAQQFNPSSPSVGGLKIEGTWEYVDGDDFLQILTRSDGTPAGSYGETNAGIEFRAFAINADEVDIKGNGATVNNSTGPTPMPGGIGGGDIFDFVITDDGFNLLLELTRTSNPLDTLTITADSTFAPGTNLVTFHNREAGRRSNLDDVIISSLTLETSVPEPSTLLMACMALAGLGLVTWRRRTRQTLVLVFAIGIALAAGVPTQAATYVSDDFNDNYLDPSQWMVLDDTTPGGAWVAEQNQRVEIYQRGHLVTTAQFDPTVVGPVTMQGEWTFANVNGLDMFQVLMRSDGQPAGANGETNNGIEYYLQSNGQPTIRTRGSSLSVGSVNLTGSLTIAQGNTFDFTITDDGTNLSWVMTQQGNSANTATVSAQVTSDTFAMDRIAFHNRESGGRLAYLDNVSIESSARPSRLDESIGVSSKGFTVRDVKSTGTLIDSLADADALLAGIGIANETTDTGVGVINYFDTGGNGNYGADSPFPNGGGDDFAVNATAALFVTQSGIYTFGDNTDDGSRLRIDGIDVFVDDATGGPHDTFGSLFLSEGRHDLDYVYFERSGGAETELFAAPGTHTSFNANFQPLTFAITVPEPSTFLMAFTALVGLGLFWRRRRTRVA